MGPVDIAIIVIVSVAFVSALGVIIWRKIKHKSDCGCNGCSHCDKCKK